MKTFFTLVLFLLNISFINATIRNVPSAYSSIQSALNSCSSGDTVNVMPGTYYENIIWPSTSNIKLISLGDTSNTIINGSNLGSVIKFDFDSISSNIIDSNTIIHGFKIMNGYLQDSASFGAGIYINYASPKIINVYITKNHINSPHRAYGSGIHCNNSKLKICNSSISGNKIDSARWGYGCGLYCESSNIVVDNTDFSLNYLNSDSWGYGCCIYSRKSNLLIKRSSFMNNNLISDSYGYGTGLYLDSCYVILSNTKINNNSIKSKSWGFGTGIYCNVSNLILTNVDISKNVIDTGGVYYYGGGIYFRCSDASLTNVLISENLLGATNNFGSGGGICVLNWAHYGFKVINMMNVTITNNARIDGGGIGGSGINSHLADSTKITITNSIIYNPNIYNEIMQKDSISITYSNIRGGYSGIGNIDTIPGFISSTDFHLDSISPCVNAGTLTGAPLFDLDNKPRPLPTLTNPDMGCYEEGYYSGVSIKSLNYKEELFENFPNPFAEQTTLVYYLDNPGYVQIQIYNLQGRHIATYNDVVNNSGKQSFILKANDFPSGVYLCKLKSNSKVQTIKIIKK